MRKFKEIAPLIVIVFLMIALCSSSAIVHASEVAFVLPAETTQITPTYTYVLPNNYVVNYTIVQMPPPDQYSVNPYAYNIVVYGPHPFPIQISFYEQTAENTTQKINVIMPTNSFSTSIGCTSYPTQITMIQVDSEPVSPSPTMSTSPTSYSPYPSAEASPSASFSPSPSPSQTSNTSPSPTIEPTSTEPARTNKPTPSQSSLPSQEPTSSPNQQPDLQEAYYIVAVLAAVVIVAAVALVLRKRRNAT